MPETDRLPYSRRLFDAPPPPIPEIIPGVSSEAAVSAMAAFIDISREFGIGSGPFLRSIESANTAKGAVVVFDMARRAASGETISPQEVGNNRRYVRQLNEFAGLADGCLGCFSVLFPPLLLLRAPINERFDVEASKAIPQFVHKIEAGMDAASPYVELVAGFENPRNQYVKEVEAIYNQITKDGRRGRLTHQSVADATVHVVGELLVDDSSTLKYPLLQGILRASMVGTTHGLSKVDRQANNLAIFAPDILRALEQVLPEDNRPNLSFDLARNQHPLRTAAEFFASGRSQAITKQLPSLLVGIRDMLPENGQDFLRDFESLKREFK